MHTHSRILLSIDSMYVVRARGLYLARVVKLDRYRCLSNECTLPRRPHPVVNVGVSLQNTRTLPRYLSDIGH
jgi:hypothetical protein